MLRFVGQGVQVFKPGMVFETQVSVKYSDQVEKCKIIICSLILRLLREKALHFYPPPVAFFGIFLNGKNRV